MLFTFTHHNTNTHNSLHKAPRSVIIQSLKHSYWDTHPGCVDIHGASYTDIKTRFCHRTRYILRLSISLTWRIGEICAKKYFWATIWTIMWFQCQCQVFLRSVMLFVKTTVSHLDMHVFMQVGMRQLLEYLCFWRYFLFGLLIQNVLLIYVLAEQGQDIYLLKLHMRYGV